MNRQYIVTAKHVVGTLGDGNVIQLQHNGAWKNLNVTVVGYGAGKADIAVFATTVRLAAPGLKLPAHAGKSELGQDVALLGFPLGLDFKAASINADFPFAMVKRGSLSMCFARAKGQTVFLVDAHAPVGL